MNNHSLINGIGDTKALITYKNPGGGNDNAITNPFTTPSG